MASLLPTCRGCCRKFTSADSVARGKRPASPPHGGLRRSGRDAPHHVANVVGPQQRAGAIDGDAARPAERLFLVVDEAGENVDRLTGRTALRERHEDHLVAAARVAVPRAMLADEGTV